MADSNEANRAQLAMVEMALSGDPTNPDLLQLRTDIQLLIQLTEESLQEDQAGEERPVGAEQEGTDEPPVDASSLTTLDEDLSSLEGIKVLAPFSTQYSGQSYHNAVIFAAEQQQPDGDEEENVSAANTTFEDIKVRVVFSHPTEVGMVPCRHFLNGTCFRGEEGCKWSHGERVRLAELRQWEEPDWARVTQGSIVLTRREEGIWARGVVQAVETDQVVIKLEGVNIEPFAEKLENILPLGSDHTTHCDSNSDNEDEADDHLSSRLHAEENDNDDEFVPVSLAVTGSLGEWESHTKGLGSALMAKMGWQGGGLGKDGEGRVDPVTAMVYPQGKSLDWCMDARERAGGGDMLSVEKKLKKDAKRELKRTLKLKERAEKEEHGGAKSLFDFINKKLGGARKHDSLGRGANSRQGDGKQKGSGGASGNTTLTKKSNQSLRIESFQLSEKIRGCEKEMSRLRDSWERHRHKDPRTAAQIHQKIEQKTTELRRLQQGEKRLKSEQGARKDKSKLQIF